MALLISFLFILTGLTGVHSMVEVSKVSVKAGQSISIPCLYESRYKDRVKYLCKGNNWNFCSYAIKTNQPNSQKFSISDDKKGIFTVTIKDLTGKDTDYWCNVEINNGPDNGYYFQLSVTGGTPRVYVDQQEITGYNGGNITIKCHHRTSGENKWCRLGGSCVTKSSESFSGTRVTIKANSTFFDVTMRGLTTESSGWYMCVKAPAPTSTSTSTTAQGALNSDGPGLEKFIIPLGLLILIVMVTLLVWFLLKRHKQRKAESPAPTTVEEEVSYSSVMYKKKTSNKRSDAKCDVDVTYSSVVISNDKQQTEEMVEAKAEDVVYSSLALCQKSL
uniref:CMRF35-like molecule 1 isoform X2 n=1 Tax=Semicossyphus pulcher TaxID=241346 RepID=UPI0037E86659